MWDKGKKLYADFWENIDGTKGSEIPRYRRDGVEISTFGGVSKWVRSVLTPSQAETQSTSHYAMLTPNFQSRCI